MAVIGTFGSLDGRKVDIITIKGEGIECDLISFGATIRAIRVPDRDGVLRDVCLGYDEPQSYRDNEGCLGGSIGRYANRIAGARFVLDGVTYEISKNSGEHSLHGGKTGFHKRHWDYETGEDSVTFAIFSPDGDEGYPGNFWEEVTYTARDGSLLVEYRAVCDNPTPVNLTNHCYFNLGGHDSGYIGNHVIELHADYYTPTDEDNIPTGEIRSVEGTVYDLRKPTVLGTRLELPRMSGGFDRNFALVTDVTPKARLYCPETGIGMTVDTDLEGVQLYTAATLEPCIGKGGAQYGKAMGLCLETQHYPDAVNHTNFPSSILRPGEEFRSFTRYSFEAY